MQSESNSSIKKIVTIVIVVAFVLFVIYYFFFHSTTPQVTVDQFGNPVSAQVVGQDLVDLLNKLQSVTLDDSIFHDSAFINLTDFDITLPNIPQGRANPFDPYSGQVMTTPITSVTPKGK